MMVSFLKANEFFYTAEQIMEEAGKWGDELLYPAENGYALFA